MNEKTFQLKYKYQVSLEYPRVNYCWVCEKCIELESLCNHPELDTPMETSLRLGMCKELEPKGERKMKMDKAEKVSILSVAIGSSERNINALMSKRIHLNEEIYQWQAQLMLFENEKDRLMKEGTE